VLQFQVFVFASVADAVIIRDDADRNSEKQSEVSVGSQGATDFRATGYNVTSGGYVIDETQDTLYRHGGTTSVPTESDGHSILGLQLPNSSPEIGINVVPAVLSPIPVPVPQMVALVSPYQVPMSAAQGLQLAATSTGDKRSSPIVGDVTGNIGQIVLTSNHGIAAGLGFGKGLQDQVSSAVAGSSGTGMSQLSNFVQETSGLGLLQESASLLHNSSAEHIPQLQHVIDNSGAYQASTVWPGYEKHNPGQISSIRLGSKSVFPAYGYNLISSISDLSDGKNLGTGTPNLGHRSNIALGSEQNNVGSVLPNTDIHLASGYTKESAASNYGNIDVKHGTGNFFISDNSGVTRDVSFDNSNIFTGQAPKFSILSEHLDSSHNSNLKVGSDIGNSSLFGIGTLSSNMLRNSGTDLKGPGLEQDRSLITSSSGNIANFGYGSNVFGHDQSFSILSGSAAADLGHTTSAGSELARTMLGQQTGVPFEKHQKLESAPSSISASNYDLSSPGQRKISGSVRDLSNGAGLYFTALEKDSNLNSAYSLPTLFHGSGRPSREHSLGSGSAAQLHFTTHGKYQNSGSASMPSVSRHGPKYTVGSGSSNLGYPSSRPTYSGTSSVRQTHTGSGSILGQGSSLQAQTSVVGSRYYGPKYGQSSGVSYLGQPHQRGGLGLRYRSISNTENGKGNSGFKQTSEPGIGLGINSLGNIGNIKSGSSDYSLAQYDQGFGTGSLIYGKGSGSSSLGSLISGNQRGLGYQINKSVSAATSTSNFNLGNYDVGKVGLTRQSFHQDTQVDSL
jgi:hypothetical protein